MSEPSTTAESWSALVHARIEELDYSVTRSKVVANWERAAERRSDQIVSYSQGCHDAHLEAFTHLSTQVELLKGLVRDLYEIISDQDAALAKSGYQGVWKAGQTYTRGQLVTFSGSLWACQRSTTHNPNDSGPGDWALAAKKGRDGKDAR